MGLKNKKQIKIKYTDGNLEPKNINIFDGITKRTTPTHRSIIMRKSPKNKFEIDRIKNQKMMKKTTKDFKYRTFYLSHPNTHSHIQTQT